jgi:pseudouridine synthase
LQKVMADVGVASRRDCEQLIADGRVRVNGEPVTRLPAWVDPMQDRIEVDGVAIARPGRRASEPKKTYVMVHKPRSVISTNDDPEGRVRVIDLVRLPGEPRLYPVGRLDADSTGLILLTNDGELANRLTHPRYGVSKEYRVSVAGRLTEEDVKKLRDGLYLAHRSGPEDKTPKVKKAAMERVRMLGYDVDRARGDRTLLSVTLQEGQNREIRRLLARLGLKVRKLKRVAIGPLRLSKLAVGEWRLLTSVELKMLQKAAGLGGKPAGKTGKREARPVDES